MAEGRRGGLLAAAFVAWTAVVVALWAHGSAARLAIFEHQGLRVLAVAALVFGAWGIGTALLSLARVAIPGAAAVAIALGSGVLGLGWGAVASMSDAGSAHAWGFLVPCLLAGAGAIAWRRSLRDGAPARVAWALPPGVLLPLALALGGVLVVLPLALAPPASTDELVYHLTIAKWRLAGLPAAALSRFSHAGFPRQVELLYSWALALGQPVAAKLVHFSLGLCAAVLAAACARAGRGVLAGAFAAAALLTTPVLLLNMGWAWADAACALEVLAACVLTWSAAQTGSRGTAALAGMAWGLSLATKYTAALYLVVGVVALLWPEDRSRAAIARRLRLAGVAAAAAIPFFAGWLVLNAATFGNPVHPIGDTLWGEGTLIGQEQLYADQGTRESLRDRALGIFEYAFWNRRTDDTTGFLWLLALPVLAFVPLSPLARRLHVIAAACMVVLSAGFAGSVRLQIPALVLLAVPVGEWLASWWEAGGPRRAAGAALLSACAVSNLAVLAWHDREFFDPVRVALGYESEAAYLDRMEPSFSVLQRLNETAPRGGVVLSIAADRLFWLDVPVIASGPLDVPVVRDWVRGAPDAETLAGRMREQHVTHVLLDRTSFERDVVNGPGRAAWTDEELFVLADFLERLAIKDVRKDGFELYLVPPG